MVFDFHKNYAKVPSLADWKKANMDLYHNFQSNLTISARTIIGLPVTSVKKIKHFPIAIGVFLVRITSWRETTHLGHICLWAEGLLLWNRAYLNLDVSWLWLVRNYQRSGVTYTRDARPPHPATRKNGLPRPAKSKPCPAPPRRNWQKPAGPSGAKLTIDYTD